MARDELKVRLAAYAKLPLGFAAERIAKRALQRWLEWGTLVFLEQDLEATPQVPGSDSDNVRELRATDLPTLAGFGRHPGELARRLDRGDRAFAYVDPHSGLSLHVRWGTTAATWIPELGLWLRPGAGEFYLYDVVTVPQRRGSRLAGVVGAAMDRDYAERGFHKKLGEPAPNSWTPPM